MAENLTEKQRLFVEAYMGQAAGNATEAARLAGYSHKYADRQANQLLENTRVRAAIKKRQDNHPLVASREDRQRFWTKVMDDETEDMRNRLRASEILGKASGDFIERVDMTSGGKPLSTINVVIHRGTVD